MENKKIIFKCRVCGGTEYGEMRHGSGSLGPGYYAVSDYYFCELCGVMFTSPEKFSSQKAEKKLQA